MWSILTFPFRLLGMVVGFVFELIGAIFSFAMGLVGGLFGILIGGFFLALMGIGVVAVVRWVVRGVTSI